ncbi:LysR family transcriptional regulator [Microbacterium sp. KR10-403]|uniref:LysR family transcriptional regulator n=1 Tax=Microbacterium sp. KR10-403 TaxID=3158581 RepID=UPI0032E409AA
MKIGGLDLNLMLALDALLREASVTRAAERLNLTQPTLSQSLARLRRHFDDELLRRNGKDMELTPLAVRLRPMVADALDSAQRVFAAHRAIDPETSTRRFSIAASDYGIGAVGAVWSARVGRFAPNMRLAFRSIAVEQLTPYEVHTRDVDGILAPHGLFPEDMPHFDVLADRWVIIADAQNTALGDRPGAGELRELPWVTTFETALVSPAEMHRHEWASIARDVAVVVDRFSDMPLCVRGTQRVALIQERLLHALGPHDGLRVMAPPFPLAPIVLAFWWHPSYDGDLEHMWVRAQFEHFRNRSPLGS